MANNSDNKEKTIVLVQRWGVGKIKIGTEFNLKGSNRILKLVECEGYPHGKFIFEDGEEFNVGKYFDSYFIELGKEKSNIEEKQSVYDETFWDMLDEQLNGDNKNIIRKTFVDSQKNEGYKNIIGYDVSKIIEDLIKYSNDEIDPELTKNLYGNIMNNNFPFFTKEKLYGLFSNCTYEKTKRSHIFIIKKNDVGIGYLVSEDKKYIFVPKNPKLKNEYSFENDSAIGFFYTAESYLDVALSTIENYEKQFINIYHFDIEKNQTSYGYQADSTIKTILAFSCECFLKSLLINEGKQLNDLKNLGHGLSVLYTSLDDNIIAEVFAYMKRNRYNLDKNNPTYETNDLTEKFMLDLAKVDAAFIDSRYCAENDKNTDYSFLYKFAIALRNCSQKEFMSVSPFANSIESKISKR